MKGLSIILCLLLVGCSASYQHKCIDVAVVKELVKSNYRTVTVRLTDGRLLNLYTPTIAPGDTICMDHNNGRVIK